MISGSGGILRFSMPVQGCFVIGANFEKGEGNASY
jgi:hypothetical protein